MNDKLSAEQARQASLKKQMDAYIKTIPKEMQKRSIWNKPEVINNQLTLKNTNHVN